MPKSSFSGSLSVSRVFDAHDVVKLHQAYPVGLEGRPGRIALVVEARRKPLCRPGHKGAAARTGVVRPYPGYYSEDTGIAPGT